MKTIPFRDDMAMLIREGQKTATTRTTKYGSVGDELMTKAGVVRLTRIARLPLGEVAQHFYRQEGFESPGMFVAVWKEIHPRRGFDARQQVYLHTFELAAVPSEGTES